MKFVLFAVLACAALVAADVDVAFTDCGTSDDIGKISRITASVFPPKVGSHMSMHQFHDNFKSAVTGGTYEIVTKLGALTVDTKKGDICTYGSLTCPSATGAVQIDLESDVGSVPSGTYTMKTTGKTASGASIWCHQVTFKI